MPITPSPHLASDHEALHREADAVARALKAQAVDAAR